MLFGSRWFARADGFEVMSSLFGRLSVLGRRDDGVLVVRSPLAGLDQLRVEPGLVALVSVLLGSTAYDGVTQGLWWVQLQQGSPWPQVVTGSLGLSRWWRSSPPRSAVRRGPPAGSRGPAPGAWPAEFAPSLVPIALGYVSRTTGRCSCSSASRPCPALRPARHRRRLARHRPTAARPTPGSARGTTSTLQVIFVVTGHVVGIVLAHDRAVRLLPRQRAVIGQLPLLAVMVGYTLAGLLLLFSQ